MSCILPGFKLKRLQDLTVTANSVKQMFIVRKDKLVSGAKCQLQSEEQHCGIVGRDRII